MFLDQFADLMIIILVVAAAIAGLVGDAKDAIVIVIIVVLNAVIGFVQEFRAERAVAALKALAAPVARVRRDGQDRTVAAVDLVPGDIVLLEAGNVVPADLRLLEAADVKVDEAALTGESESVLKATPSLEQKDLPLGERINLLYKGTLLTNGRATAVTVATGMQTELGHIAQLLVEEDVGRTPLQKRLARFGRSLAIAVLGISAVVFVAGLLRGEAPVLMFLTAVSLAVAAIPEALPAVVTVSLALGARRMARRNALIRHLPAVETLGSVTFVCADKTGTLTQNIMRAERFYADGRLLDSMPANVEAGAPWYLLGQAMALCNDAYRSEGAIKGDPTEAAFLVAAEQAGYGKSDLERSLPRVAEIPFDAERKRMTTLHRSEDGVVAYTKGAPEQLLDHCDHVLTGEGLHPLDPAVVHAQAEALAGEGYRVLAFACRSLPQVPEVPAPEGVETNLTFLGLVALLDPPRPEVRNAVAFCQSAGITPVMITGDHPATAKAMAVRLGIIRRHDHVMDGARLARISLASLEKEIEAIRVYARVSPEQKIKIVNALQDRGEFVAMTGDGVNDAPALKSADIGVAMGLKGTDVAREAADMVLLDDNFATIVAAVREGRRIYDNIRKFIKYVITGNVGEICTLFLAPFVGLPIPLLPIHILWINLVTDGLPGLAMAAERHERGIMQRPPRPPNESIFARGMWQYMVWMGLLIGGLSLLVQAGALATGRHWQTMVFTVLTLSQLVNSLAVRSERESLFSIGVTSNRPLFAAVVLTLLLQLAVIYIPVLNPIFNTEPLVADELAICLALPLAVLVASEIEKWLIRRGWLYGLPGPAVSPRGKKA